MCYTERTNHCGRRELQQGVLGLVERLTFCFFKLEYKTITLSVILVYKRFELLK